MIKHNEQQVLSWIVIFLSQMFLVANILILEFSENKQLTTWTNIDNIYHYHVVVKQMEHVLVSRKSLNWHKTSWNRNSVLKSDMFPCPVHINSF